MNSTRREFIHRLSLACGSIMFIPACSGYNSVWRFFTENEAKTVISFAEQIIPRDQDPGCLLYTSPSPRDRQKSRMPSSA
jgi:hypothetical protein